MVLCSWIAFHWRTELEDHCRQLRKKTVKYAVYEYCVSVDLLLRWIWATSSMFCEMFRHFTFCWRSQKMLYSACTLKYDFGLICFIRCWWCVDCRDVARQRGWTNIQPRIRRRCTMFLVLTALLTKWRFVFYVRVLLDLFIISFKRVTFMESNFVICHLFLPILSTLTLT